MLSMKRYSILNEAGYPSIWPFSTAFFELSCFPPQTRIVALQYSNHSAEPIKKIGSEIDAILDPRTLPLPPVPFVPSLLRPSNSSPSSAMRGLNLSRLARGRASESSFFKEQQAQQASKLRASLSPADLASAKSQPSVAPSVDTLSEISAQRAYRELLKRPSAPPATPPSRPLLSRLARLTPASYEGLAQKCPNPAAAGPDPAVLRALGSAKLNLYASLPAQRAAPLPGGEHYADGAVLGMTSFSVATALVASVGLAGGLVVYLNPGVVDSMRAGSIRFGASIDNTLGVRLRGFRDKMQSRGPILSDDVERRARQIATSAVKLPASGPTPADGRKDGFRASESGR